MNPVNKASIQIFEEYLIILEHQSIFPRHSGGIDEEHLRKICKVAIKNPQWPVDKMSRWLGFVQGVMIFNNIVSVDSERGRTRPLFHKAYKELGMEIPDSVSVDDEDN